MNYKLTDQCGTVIAKGDQLRLEISVNLEGDEMTVRSGAVTTVCDIAGGDKFTLSFERPKFAPVMPTHAPTTAAEHNKFPRGRWS